MSSLYIFNPGSGAVDGATLENATENMKQFIDDSEVKGATFHKAIYEPDYGDGRCSFDVVWKGRVINIQMPGLPLDQVRFMDSDTQNIWDFPRLYVDHSSWVWKYAILKEVNLVSASGDGRAGSA